jgi:hypothetical protein
MTSAGAATQSMRRMCHLWVCRARGAAQYPCGQQTMPLGRERARDFFSPGRPGRETGKGFARITLA